MSIKDKALKNLELKKKALELTEAADKLALSINDGVEYPIMIKTVEQVREQLRIVQVGICPHSIFAGGQCALCGASYDEAGLRTVN